MAYIGRSTDKISNVEVLDNITFDGSSSYTLQKNSVNFTPSSANTLLVSIDGVVQAGNFTVSGSTIDFGTAVAGTSTCDFILHYGVGLITTPSDGTVTSAKIGANAVTNAKLNNDIISGATELASEPADTDEFLVSDAGTLKRIDYSLIKGGGITDFDSWRLTSNFTGSGGTIDGSWERQDTNSQNIKQGTGMTQSSGVFTFPNTGIWKIEFWTNLVPAGSYNYNGFYVEYSTNSGSNFSYLNGAWGSTSASGKSITIGASNFLNVSNASTYRVRAKASGAGNAEYQANTSVNYTYFNFIRLGDST